MTSSTVMSRPLTSLAFVGQTSAHFPQFPHFARSSVETAPLMTAAPVGQIIWHAPQPVQRLAKKAPERKKSGIPDCCTRCSAADSLSGKPSSVCPDHPSLTSAEYCTPFPGSFPLRLSLPSRQSARIRELAAGENSAAASSVISACRRRRTVFTRRTRCA